MSSLKANFDELRERIRHGRELGHAGFEPIYYLIFNPADIIGVKRLTPAWIAKLRNEGWDVSAFSIAEAIENILSNDPRRPLWLMAQKKASHDWEKTNQALANALISNGALQQRLEEAISAMEGNKNGLVLVTDLEALHPYMRIGAIESSLQSNFHVPTIFLYPGKRTGKTRLSFLGFYPEDGNYRSVHVGG